MSRFEKLIFCSGLRAFGHFFGKPFTLFPLGTDINQFRNFRYDGLLSCRQNEPHT